MKLTTKAIKAVGEKSVRLKLCVKLDFTEQWILKMIAANKDNGPLTTAAALQVIREETGLKEKEILEDEKADALR